ncbi:hypothetical protein DD237_007280 [Peronospora effusa]|uniref:Uncharacterized protein n=1 Tax=Peronospora effusa TaxID=542832 RepID=A0A3R7XTL8_9STRA|nr:hypothetical protein DD237_007280 [Peronospora effusa]
MFFATSWITEHRNKIVTHYAEMSTVRRASDPKSVVYKILYSAIASITSTVYSVVMRLQGHRLTISQQESIIQQIDSRLNAHHQIGEPV